MRIPSANITTVIYFMAFDSNDGVTPKTGLSSFTVYRSRNGGAAALYTTPTVTEISLANMPGLYGLLVDEDTTLTGTDLSEEYAVTITATGMIRVNRTVEIYLPQAPLVVPLTESYSTLGGTKTAAQALYECTQRDQNVAIVGTTMTLNKVDGTTPALTATLNSATTPTTVTRATASRSAIFRRHTRHSAAQRCCRSCRMVRRARPRPAISRCSHQPVHRGRPVPPVLPVLPAVSPARLDRRAPAGISVPPDLRVRQG